MDAYQETSRRPQLQCSQEVFMPARLTAAISQKPHKMFRLSGLYHSGLLSVVILRFRYFFAISACIADCSASVPLATTLGWSS